MSEEPTVVVVDDDDGVRDSVRVLLESVGLQVITFPSATAFLESGVPEDCTCLISDVRMPGMTGIQLQEALTAAGIEIDIIMLTGHGDVRTAVQALKNGAVEFLEKPFDDEELIAAIGRILKRRAESSNGRAQRSLLLARYETLTPREREVLAEMLTGAPNKVIGHTLGVSPRTVEVHRARVLQKMEATNLPHLMRLALAAGLDRRRQ